MKLQPTSQFDPLEPGMYLASVESITAEKSQFEDGSDQLKWIFNVQGEDPATGAPADFKVFAWSGQTYGVKSKTLRPWAVALLGPGWNPDTDGLDTDLLVGKACRIVVINKIGNDGKERNRVNAVMPVETRRRQQAPVPVAQEPAPELVAAGVGEEEHEVPF